MIQLLMKKDSTIHTISEIRKFQSLDFFFILHFEQLWIWKLEKRFKNKETAQRPSDSTTTFSSLQMSNE